MNDMGISQINELSNGAEILSALESHGFEYLTDGASTFGKFFYFRRDGVIIKVCEGISSIEKHYAIGMWVYLNTLSLNSDQSISRVLHNRQFIYIREISECTRQFDKLLNVEDEFLVMGNLGMPSVSLSESELLAYLGDCLIMLSSYYMSNNLSLV